MIRAAQALFVCLLGCLGLAACATPPLPGDELSEADRHLVAIRTLLSFDPSQAPDSKVIASQGSSKVDREKAPRSTVDALRWAQNEASIRDRTQQVRQPHHGGHSRSELDAFRVVIPWRPETGPSIRAEEAFRPVSPYTYAPPLGSVYPGTLRCVPDMLGGQRCGR